MFLAIDIGNTNTVFTLFLEESNAVFISECFSGLPNHLTRSWRISTSKTRTADEYIALFFAWLNSDGIDLSEIKSVGISSVVDGSFWNIEKFVRQYFKIIPFVLSLSAQTILSFADSARDTLGADLIAAANGAALLYQKSCIIVDCGTATTFSVVLKINNQKWQYMGGAIALGIHSTLNAIPCAIPALPAFSTIALPKDICSTKIEDAMMSGLYYGHIGMIEYFVKHLKDKYINEKDFLVVITGGISQILFERLSIPCVFNPFIVELGIKFSHDMAASQVIPIPTNNRI